MLDKKEKKEREIEFRCRGFYDVGFYGVFI